MTRLAQGHGGHTGHWRLRGIPMTKLTMDIQSSRMLSMTKTYRLLILNRQVGTSDGIQCTDPYGNTPGYQRQDDSPYSSGLHSCTGVSMLSDLLLMPLQSFPLGPIAHTGLPGLEILRDLIPC